VGGCGALLVHASPAPHRASGQASRCQACRSQACPPPPRSWLARMPATPAHPAAHAPAQVQHRVPHAGHRPLLRGRGQGHGMQRAAAGAQPEGVVSMRAASGPQRAFWSSACSWMHECRRLLVLLYRAGVPEASIHAGAAVCCSLPCRHSCPAAGAAVCCSLPCRHSCPAAARSSPASKAPEFRAACPALPPARRYNTIDQSCCSRHLTYMERPYLVMAWMHVGSSRDTKEGRGTKEGAAAAESHAPACSVCAGKGKEGAGAGTDCLPFARRRSC
jgi:hypothetical protein